MKFYRAPSYILCLTIICICLACGDGVQVVDLKADVRIEKPAYPKGKGPRIVIDAAHNNFHTATGRYEPLANLLRNDGFTISENHKPLTDSVFLNTEIFVIANADYKASGQSFSQEEIEVLYRYVERGGSLLLIADHTPFPGVIQELALRFSIRFENVFADDGGKGIFSKKNKGLVDDTLIQDISQVRTFGGSAFKIDSIPHRPLFVMDDRWTIQRMEANVLSEKESAAGYYQAAVMEIGNGKVAVFGEAAMFSAQTYGKWRTKMGFHAPGAKQNKEFIRKILLWLSQ